METDNWLTFSIPRILRKFIFKFTEHQMRYCSSALTNLETFAKNKRSFKFFKSNKQDK